MSEILGPLVIIVLCSIVSKIEFKRYNTYLTPFGVFAWPYVAIVTTVNLFGRYFGFFEISISSICFMMASLVFFVAGGQCSSNLLKERTNIVPEKPSVSEIDVLFSFYRPLFITFAIISIISGLVHFMICFEEIGGWTYIGSIEFEHKMSSGPLAHIAVLARPAFIFLFADYIHKKRKFILFLLIGILLVVFARQVKYHIISMILAGYFFSVITGRMRFLIRNLVWYSFLIFIIFNVTYLIGFFAASTDYALAYKTHILLLNLFFSYLFGGPIGFSEILSHSEFPIYSFKEIFAVPINIYKFIFDPGYYIDIVIHYRIPISNAHELTHNTNIFGMVGMLYMYLGTFFTFIYMFVFGFVVYFIMRLSLKYRKGIKVNLVYSFLLSILTISFFDFYFNKLVPYEIIFVMIAIPSVYSLARKLLRYHMLNVR